jgi:hypothetical protein
MRNAAKVGRFVTNGSTKLDTLIDALGLTTQAAADAIGTNRGTLHVWRYGQARPNATWRLRIAVWARGLGAAPVAIDPAVDWLLPDEVAIVTQLGAA